MSRKHLSAEPGVSSLEGFIFFQLAYNGTLEGKNSWPLLLGEIMKGSFIGKDLLSGESCGLAAGWPGECVSAGGYCVYNVKEA